MSERIRIDLEKTMKLLGEVEEIRWLASGNSEGGIPGHGPTDGSGVPVIHYAQELTSAFIQSMVAIEQQNALREASDIGVRQMTRTTVARFADDFCGSLWPSPLPLLTRWHFYPPPAPPSDGPRPLDLLAAGAEFYCAANALPNSELGKSFSAAAARLLTAALT